MRGRIVVAVVALLASGTLSAFAEPGGRHFEFSPLTGFTTYDKTPNELTRHSLKDAIHFGGRLGFGWSPALAVEAGVGFTPTQEDVVNGLSLNDVPLSLNALWSPVRTRTLWPYVLLGGAKRTVRRDEGGGSASQNAAVAGLGLRYWLSDAVGLRAEASDMVSLQRNSIFHDRSQTYTVSGGLTFAFP